MPDWLTFYVQKTNEWMNTLGMLPYSKNIAWNTSNMWTKEVLSDISGYKQRLVPSPKATRYCCYCVCLPLHRHCIVTMLPLSLIAIALVIVIHVLFSLVHPLYTNTAVSFLQFRLMTSHPPSVDPLQVTACWKHHCCFKSGRPAVHHFEL